jgi:hypothetical protein
MKENINNNLNSSTEGTNTQLQNFLSQASHLPRPPVHDESKSNYNLPTTSLTGLPVLNKYN